MGKSRRSFGQIDKLPSGRYRARYIGPDLALHKAPQTYLARIDAEGWLSEEDRMIGRGEWTPPAEREARSRAAPLTVPAYLDVVIAQRSKRTRRPLRPSTIDLYRKLVRLVIAPELGDVPLTGLTAELVRQWHDGLPPENQTQNAAAYSLLKSALTDAVEEGLITANPCRIRGAGGKPAPRHKAEALALTEVVAYLEAVPERYRLALALAGWCGLRSGEIRALRRRDIDLTDGLVRVHQTVSRVQTDAGREWHIGPPKTAAGERSAAIPPHLLPAVKQWLKSTPMTGRDGLLFPASDGKSPLNTSVLRDAHVKAREAIGRPTLRVHDLRRTAATIAAQEGATTAEIMRLLGHTTVDVAMLYQVASEKRDMERAQRLSAAVAKATAPNPPQ